MDIFKPNEDKNLRLVAMHTLSQRKSTSDPLWFNLISYSELIKCDKAFADSESIKTFFNDPNFTDACILICVYELKNSKETRRRIAIIKRPFTTESIESLVINIAKSLNINVQFHTLEIKSGSLQLNEVNKIKEGPNFITTLIEYYDKNLNDPLKQLDKVKEILLKKATNTGGSPYYIMGGVLNDYLNKEENFYRIAAVFGEQLNKTDLKLATEYIPKIGNIFIEFPFAFKFKDFYIRNVFLTVNYNYDSKGISFACPKFVDGFWDGSIFYTSVDISTSEDIDTSLKETAKYFYDTEVVQINDITTYTNFIKYCLKCIIYIESEEPNLTRELKSVTDKKNITKIRKFYKDHCPFNIISVGYDFHGRQYNMNETLVRGFFRWQPCGVQFSKVKLIWIDEFTRHFNAKD